jgi:ribosome biogenesis GTPase
MEENKKHTEAIVYRSTGSWYDIRTTQGEAWKARIKGIFKIEGITSTNPIAVGDRVDVELEDPLEKTALITHIHQRHNYISRQSPGHRKQHHIIASNLDQSLLVATIREPRTSTGFIDRFLVAGEAYHVPSLLLVNKCDDWRQKEEAIFESWHQCYEPLGYPVMKISATTGEGLEAVRLCLKNKTSLLSGHSGVGKSSLLNALVPDFRLRVGDLSHWSGKGMHTTTFAEMFDLPFEGKVVDTPGIREFGVVDIRPNELSHYFPEMRNLLHHCQFNNCLHDNEPGCAIKKAVASGGISERRYQSYFNILHSLPGEHWE